MGSIFRLPVVSPEPHGTAHRDLSLKILADLKHHGVRLIGTSIEGTTRHVHAPLAGPAAVIVGGEGAGLPDDALAACDEVVRIPLHPRVESLNVAAAAAVILYEAARQRGFDGLV